MVTRSDLQAGSRFVIHDCVRSFVISDSYQDNCRVVCECDSMTCKVGFGLGFMIMPGGS